MKSGSRLKPVKEFRIYKRNLPHWENPGSAYFITFNVAIGYELTPPAKDIVLAAIKYHIDKKYKLYACVVMKTHVHIVLLPLEQSRGVYYSLAQIMHSIKSYSAHEIQRVLHVKGSIWIDENYDRIIRNENDFFDIMNYVIFNPVKAGIVKQPVNYKWLFVSQAVTPVKR